MDAKIICINLILVFNVIKIRAYSYENLQQSPIFVDKTKFLEVFFEPTQSPRCIFLTAPSGFGKSTLISMVDLFSGVEYDGNGTFKKPYYADTFHTFKDMKVDPTCTQAGGHLAKYVILRLDCEYYPERKMPAQTDGDYEEETATPSPTQIHRILQQMIANSIDRYLHVLKVFEDQFNENDRIFLSKLIRSEISESEIHSALRNLIKILYKYFRTPVILLIDDYDRVAYGVHFKNSVPEVEVFYRLLNTMIDLSTQLGSKYVHKAFITCTNSLPFYWGGETGKELEDFHHYEFSDKHVFSEYVGFTQEDVRGIVNDKQFSPAQEMDLMQYCNGYRVVGNKTLRIYKTQCIEDHVLTKFPNNESSNELDFRSKFQDLEFIKPNLHQSNFEIQLLLLCFNESIYLPKLSARERVGLTLDKFKKDELQPVDKLRLLWTYLKEYGFVSPVPESSCPSNYYIAPNLEVIRALQEYILRYHDESILPLNSISQSLQYLANCHHDLQHPSVKKSIQDLGKFLSVCYKSDDENYDKKTHELIFQAILLVSSLKTPWLYFSRREVNYNVLGRCDMYFYNKQENVAAIVNIEYKGKLVTLPKILTTVFPHNIHYLTVLSINMKKPGFVEVSHSVREVSSRL